MALLAQTSSQSHSGPVPADPEPQDRLWTREEYERLAELGFFDRQRVELIEGRIVEMPPQKVPHRTSLELVDRYLRRAFPQGYRICIQMPFRAADGSDPEPDAAVVPGDPRSAKDHPSTASLIVEVSETTLLHDRRKARLYAASGVGEYWIVNLIDRTLELHRDPLPSGGAGIGPAYAQMRVLQGTENLSPLSAPQVSVQVAELLP